jgi:hypothetical protein
MRYLLIFIPFLSFAQTNLTKKEIISNFNITEDKFINVRKTIQIFSDTILLAENYERTILSPNDKRLYDYLQGYDDYINLAIEAWKDIADSTGFFPLNEETDSIYYLGNWRLNLNNIIINGKIKLNAKGKYIFDPNLNQPLIENIPLIIKTNLIKIKINNIDIVLIKNENGKYISNNNNVRLIKLE